MHGRLGDAVPVPSGGSFTPLLQVSVVLKKAGLTVSGDMLPLFQATLDLQLAVTICYVKASKSLNLHNPLLKSPVIANTQAFLV